MPKNTCLVINASPNPDGLGQQLAKEFKAGIIESGHFVSELLLSDCNFEDGFVEEVKNFISDANHLTFVFPIWSGMPPASLVRIIQEVFVEGFAFSRDSNGLKVPLLSKPASVLVTMGTQGPPDLQYFCDGLFYSGVEVNKIVVADNAKPGISKEKVKLFLLNAKAAGEKIFTGANSWPFE